jgi:cell division protease FtsH
MKPIVKQFLIWTVVIGSALCLNAYLGKSARGPKVLTPSFAEVMDKARAGQVKDVTYEGSTMTGHYIGGEQFRTTVPPNTDGSYGAFSENGVNITMKDQNSNQWLSMAISILPFLLLLGTPCLVLLALLYLVRRARARLPGSI